MDHVSPKRGELHAVDGLCRRLAGLGELPGDSPHLDDRKHAAVGQDCSHLQEDLELVADERRRKLVERLGAVAGLQHERAPGRNLAQRIAELFATQNASIQQKHEPMAESLAQAIYGYLLDQTAALQSTASQIESDNDSSVAHLNDASFNPDHLNMELAAAHSAQPALLQLYVGNLAGRAVAAAPPAGVGVDYSVWNYVKDVLNPGRIGPKYSDVVRTRGDASVAAVVIAVPILDARRGLVGFLAGTVDLSEVQRLSMIGAEIPGTPYGMAQITSRSSHLRNVLRHPYSTGKFAVGFGAGRFLARGRRTPGCSSCSAHLRMTCRPCSGQFARRLGRSR